jgi:hypothetical protein
MVKLLEAAGFALYLITILYIGTYISRNNTGNKSHLVFGYLAFILAMAESLYFIPRLYGLLTDGLENHLRILGFGRIGQMLILTLFFLMLTDLVKVRFNLKRKLPMDKLLLALLLFRAVIGLFPQNQWFQLVPDSTFIFLRYIPLVLYVLFLTMTILAHSLKKNDPSFVVISILLLILLMFVEPSIWSIEKIWLTYIMASARGILFVTILFIGFREVRKDNELSRY